jgi:hypothetical protein
MAKYFIRYIGHVIQQPGIQMPFQVFQDFTKEFDKEDGDGGLKQFVNGMAFALLQQGGMAGLKQPNKIQDGTQITYDQRMVVPMHMIAYIDCVVRRIEEQKPAIPEIPLLEDDPTTVPISVN